MNRVIVQAPTESEVLRAAEVLSRLEPGYLPKPLFDVLARLVVMAIIELVPVRRTADGRTEVLLTQRGPDDTWWPDQWHNPGTVIRPSDEPYTYKDAFRRLLDDELAGTALAGVPTLVEPIHNYIDRGYNQALVYWAEVTGEPRAGRFFDSRNLPGNTMMVQRRLIQDAVNHYERCRRETLGL
jgi:hypothetical protein